MFTVNANFLHLILECRMKQWINLRSSMWLFFILLTANLQPERISHYQATLSFTIKDYVYICHMSLKQTKHTHKPMKYLPFHLWINTTLTVISQHQEHITTETPQRLHQIWQISHEYGKLMQLAGGKNQIFSTFPGQRRFWTFQQGGKGGGSGQKQKWGTNILKACM
jgi:hypothetical protein